MKYEEHCLTQDDKAIEDSRLMSDEQYYDDGSPPISVIRRTPILKLRHKDYKLNYGGVQALYFGVRHNGESVHIDWSDEFVQIENKQEYRCNVVFYANYYLFIKHTAIQDTIKGGEK